ncbi:MAG: hypothetical protein CMH46_13070 [Muricauda sp.]|nr:MULTISPECIES: serine protease [unclassified Allomuricauda]MAU16456.1 hypothetical protein [Allomuricauda sp.]|tara:strand:- start:3423 stop:4226 length:804 start_codon:yes stop_codon:yes gene_type:complete
MEKLIFAVVMIFQVSNNQVIGTATGFFYEFENKTYLITNRHVLEYSFNSKDPKIYLKLHTDKNNLSKLKTVEVPLLENSQLTWFSFSDADVAAIPIPENLTQGAIVNYFSKKNFPPKDIQLEIGSELIALGYPRGFTDNINMTPIAKTCIISTPLNTPFENKPFFIMDGNLMPGMSGSPIILRPSSTHNVKGGIAFSSEPVSYFLGIHSASISKKIGEKEEPIYKVENGEIKISGFKTVPIKENLGLQTCWYNAIIENLLEKTSGKK